MPKKKSDADVATRPNDLQADGLTSLSCKGEVFAILYSVVSTVEPPASQTAIFSPTYKVRSVNILEQEGKSETTTNLKPR